ncbi:MAG: trehalose-phosphatase [Planctomycetota bacterium]
MNGLPSELDGALQELARVPVLLVASDYDGTLADIVEDPAAARPDRESILAIERLAALPQTHAAVVSGRGLADLSELTGTPRRVRLVGSHGSEFEPDFATSLPAETVALRSRVHEALGELAQRFEGSSVERKAVGAAFHYRRVSPERRDEARDAAVEAAGTIDGVHVKHGKLVVELCVVATDKGRALESLRSEVGATAGIFVGDDVTDEDAFATLRGPDVGVKVGEGDTVAAYRVAGTRDVARVFARLYELRREWTTGRATVPIEEHALLSDQRSCALVTPQARVVWWCAPSIDSQSVFAELLGGPVAGRLSVEPEDGSPARSQSYDGDTMVLRTEFDGFTVTDYLDASMGRPNQRPARSDLVRVLEGAGRVRVEFAPRLDYGRQITRVEPREDGVVVGGALRPLVLFAPGVDWQVETEGAHTKVVATIDLDDGPRTLELRYGTSSLSSHPVPEAKRRERTTRYWSEWANHLEVPDAYRSEVVRSALVLKALCHGPSGGIAAAATTSLPEHLGGVRNWDYRFTWVRDAALSADALVQLSSYTEAMAYLDWLHEVVAREAGPEQLRPLYMVSGNPVEFEAEIGELAGYAGSRPVRIGNAAAGQIQLDVFGPIVALVLALAERGAPLSDEHWRLVEDMVRAVQHRWQEPDHGIWEIRRPPRHHVHSKTMCWATLDRAVRLARMWGTPVEPAWEKLRDEIRAEVLERGWNERVGAFTAAYDSDDLDAAVLQIGLCGLVDADDARFRSTVDALERELFRGRTLLRYVSDDGLPGIEGGFHLLTAWLADARILLGQRERAEALYRGLVASAGATGLLPEQVDPESGVGLGNHPQAYSHLALIHTALRLAGRIA